MRSLFKIYSFKPAYTFSSTITTTPRKDQRAKYQSYFVCIHCIANYTKLCNTQNSTDVSYTFVDLADSEQLMSELCALLGRG